MSLETKYLRGQLNGVKASLNNQTLRLAAVDAIDNGLRLLDARDGLEAAGKDLGDLDSALLASLPESIDSSVTAVNGASVSVPSLASISAGLAALGE